MFEQCLVYNESCESVYEPKTRKCFLPWAGLEALNSSV